MNSPEIHTHTHTHTHIYTLTCIYDHVEHSKPVGEKNGLFSKPHTKIYFREPGNYMGFKKKFFFKSRRKK